MANWLITGGAGYIGSHVARVLVSLGHHVTVVDNLSKGDARRLSSSIRFVNMDCRDESNLHMLLVQEEIQGVMHFAALKDSRVSVLRPLEYWENNVGSTIATLKASRRTQVKAYILSSSCSVYGSGNKLIEEAPLNPLSPYARTKVASEMILEDHAMQESLSWCVLRYFNVIGNAEFAFAHDTSPYSLVPRTQRILDEGRDAEIYGFDYPTIDGTAIRDYLDVRDLATVHAEMGRRLLDADEGAGLPNFLNVGTGRPVTVYQVVDALIRLNELPPGRVRYEDRKPGDPVEAWADTTLVEQSLSWSAKYSLEESIAAHRSSIRTLG